MNSLITLAFFYRSVRLLNYSVKHATATGVQNHLLTVGLELTLKKGLTILKNLYASRGYHTLFLY